MHKIKRHIILIALGILAACYGVLIFVHSLSTSVEVPMKIGATYSTMEDDFYEIINNEIRLEVESNGDLLLTRDAERDQARQNEEIRELLDNDIDLLIVNPIDDEEVVPALEMAKEDGVPVIVVDGNVTDTNLFNCVIRSNNYGAGLLDARHVISQTKAANIIVLTNEVSQSCRDRANGFTETLIKSGNAYNILASYDCGGQLEKAMEVMRQALTEYGDVDVVMAINDQAAIGAMAALEEEGKLQDTMVYGVDGSPDAKSMIAEGMMTATSAQSPLKIGTKAAEVVYEILEDQPYLTDIMVPVTQITEEDIVRFGTEGWQ